MESLDTASKDELIKRIEDLKEENSKIDELTEKLRTLEGEQLNQVSATANLKVKLKN